MLYLPGATGKYDAAVATYGVQLRAWVDMQVDARLGQLLPNFLEGELESLRSEVAASQEATAHAAEASAARLEVELGAVADAQAKLLQVVEGMSRELARARADQGSGRDAWDSTSQELMRVKDQISAIERQVTSIRGELEEDAPLKELGSWAERKFAMESQRLQSLEKELGSTEARLSSKVQEINSEVARIRLDLELGAAESG
ncbi:unnamed protein product [Symbiodinium natans]|uniref:Uncharacterized protein n=1 Tax=Symbiodinium natans TaxID=878477 RepID=A0A812ML87_9DINO|nr:unnamed protein product [Symbiodinium natans]